jgi:site-specific DNA-methyltransferase (adenine-specific)
MSNRLHYGDNLDVLRAHVATESVDLVYLDPPFNSNANYNILFKSPAGQSSDAQIEAFEDTWHWNDTAEDAFDQVMRSGNAKAADLLRAMRAFLGENDMMAYLAMMAVRLLELNRVLKPTGSLYLHCDPTASHYLKLLLDGVFGAEQMQNEITWKRTFAHGSAKRFGPVHDTIFFYSKNGHHRWQDLKVGHDDVYVTKHFRNFDADRGEAFQAISLTGAGTRKGESGQPWRGIDPTKVGRHWAVPRAILAKEGLEATSTQAALQALDEAGRIYWPGKDGGTPRLKWFVSDLDGARLGDVWTDIPPISAQAKERLGYPTQKPLALLERIIAASSNEGDVVLDPFCGCGTAVHAAQKLNRQWIGIDVTHLAVSLIEKRMKDAFPGLAFTVEGTPKDLASALDLAARDKYQFQWWAVSMVDAMPYGGKKKGADGGIDGFIYFKPDGKRTEKAIVSVKGGANVSVTMIRDLHSAMEREKAPIGVFVCTTLPTGPMLKEAATVGRFEDGFGRTFPRLQILTLAELFQGKKPDIPYVDAAAGFKRAAREETGSQGALL